MAKITTLEEAGECIMCRATRKMYWPFYNLSPVSSGLGSFSARVMFLPGVVQSIFD